MARNTLYALALLALAGCASGAPAGEGAAPAATASAKAPAAIPVAARSETVETESYSFSYAYPAAAGAVPGVKDVLDADLAKRKATIAEYAADGQKASKENGFPFNRYDYQLGWDVVADLPAWLSLSAGFSTYTGGAHPNHGFDALLWDKRAERMREPLELFRSNAAFLDAVRADFCKALDKERTERREEMDINGFDECVEPTEAVIILGSSNGKTFDRIGFLMAPYIAGPYVEGSYEVTLPVTASLIAKVKPQYRDSFAIGK